MLFFERFSVKLRPYDPITKILQQYLKDDDKFTIQNDMELTILPTFLNGNHWCLLLVDFFANKIYTIDQMHIKSSILQLGEFVVE